MNGFETLHPRRPDGRFAEKPSPCPPPGSLAGLLAAAEPGDGTIVPGLIDDPTALRIVDALGVDGHDAVIVGGPVRDRLLDRPAKDVDIATSALPEQTRRVLDPMGAVHDVGAQYGTIAVHVPGVGDYEVTTYRGEEKYEPGSRRPEVRLGMALEDDLVRRDFTVNAMAWRPSTGELIDPFGGRDDLEAGILRTPLDPDVTFREDPLRIARAVRFAAVNGWEIDRGTLAAARRNADLLAGVARERRTEELRRILSHPAPEALARAVLVADRIGCTRHVFGQVDTASVLAWDLALVPPEHRLAALVHAFGNRAAATAELRALKLSNAEVARASDTSAAAEMMTAPDRSSARALVRRHDDEVIEGAWCVTRAAGRAPSHHMMDAMRERTELRRPLPVDGNDLVAAGYRGREVGAALARVEAAFLDRPNIDRAAALHAARV